MGTLCKYLMHHTIIHFVCNRIIAIKVCDATDAFHTDTVHKNHYPPGNHHASHV